MESFLLILLLAFSLTNSSQAIVVNYPSEVFIGQPFNISFSLMTPIINSTNFEYLTQGTQTENVSGHIAYKGSGGYFALFKVNLTSDQELIVSFVGTIVGPFMFNPGIVLYSYNLSTEKPDNQQGIFGVLLSWSDALYVQSLQGVWLPETFSLPSFYSGNYTVIFRNENNSVCVYSVIVDSAVHVIKYNTRIPWNSIGYVGIRLDSDTILPYSFLVKGDSYIALASPSKYVVYVNGKEYSSGYSAEGNVTLRTFSTTIVNITFPELGLSKVITISPTSGNIKENFPTLQVVLLILTGVIIGLSIWRQIKGNGR